MLSACSSRPCFSHSAPCRKPTNRTGTGSRLTDGNPTPRRSPKRRPCKDVALHGRRLALGRSPGRGSAACEGAGGATGGVGAPRSASQSACGGACGISVAESAVEAVSERDGNRRVLSLAFSRASFSFTFLQLPSVLTCMSFPRFNSRIIFSFFFQVWGKWKLAAPTSVTSKKLSKKHGESKST